MRDENVLKLASLILGALIIETALLTGKDGVAMLMGGALAGLPIGAGLEAYLARKYLASKR